MDAATHPDLGIWEVCAEVAFTAQRTIQALEGRILPDQPDEREMLLMQAEEQLAEALAAACAGKAILAIELLTAASDSCREATC